MAQISPSAFGRAGFPMGFRVPFRAVFLQDGRETSHPNPRVNPSIFAIGGSVDTLPLGHPPDGVDPDDQKEI